MPFTVWVGHPGRILSLNQGAHIVNPSIIGGRFLELRSVGLSGQL